MYSNQFDVVMLCYCCSHTFGKKYRNSYNLKDGISDVAAG